MSEHARCHDGSGRELSDETERECMLLLPWQIMSNDVLHNTAVAQ